MIVVGRDKIVWLRKEHTAKVIVSTHYEDHRERGRFVSVFIPYCYVDVHEIQDCVAHAMQRVEARADHELNSVLLHALRLLDLHDLYLEANQFMKTWSEKPE